MRKLKWAGWTGAAAGIVAAVAWSCGSTDVTCENLATCPASDGGSGSGTGGNGGCSSADPPATSTCLNEAAVFVSPKGSDASGTGKKAAPFKTIAMALQAASRTTFKRVYVCGSAFTVKSLSKGLTMEDFELVAANATMPGDSSIGVIVDSSINVAFRNVRVASGAGAAGRPGTDGMKGADGDPAGMQQRGAGAQCPFGFPAQLGGSWLSASSCGSTGGAGGTAARGNEGSAGFPGTPRTNVVDPANSNGGPKSGQDGTRGSDGLAGMAGVLSPMGASFSGAGFNPALSGGDGTDGFVAQGGGGGGASDTTSSTCIGASGGAGGIGGCGGKKGTGGGSGGASIAVLSWMSGVSFTDCVLIAGNGGNGGRGGNGGPGGLGRPGAEGGAGFAGDAGDMIAKGGHGGLGGNGGSGGSGTGGSGGPSYALVYKGDSPARSSLMTVPGTKGLGGVGGTVANVNAPSGSDGDSRGEFPVP